MRLWCVLCFIGCIHAEIKVQFNVVSKSENPIVKSALSEVLASYNLSEPLNVDFQVVFMNATIVKGQCAPGYFWKLDKCVPCVCSVYAPSDIKTIWFEPLL